MGRGWRAGRSLPLLAGAALAGSLVAAAPVTAEDRGAEPGPGLEWGPCPEDLPTGATALECSTLAVPLDYGDPDGAEIEIMVSRLSSAAPGERRGVLLLNPGGPGSSGLGMPADLVSLGIPGSVLNSYDLIGMDPRGVGRSSPVSCGFTTDQDYIGNVPPYAVDDDAVLAQAGIAEAVAAQCAENDDAGLLPHLSTANTARDMDRVRAALGEEEISYFGVSYGSALGAAYTSLFPGRSDRIVLDSNVGDTYLGSEGVRAFGRGAEEAFPDFAAWAAQRHDTYGLGATPGEVRETYFEIAEGLDAEPMEGFDGRHFRFYTFIGLYGEANYTTAAQMWQSVHDPAPGQAPRLPQGEAAGGSVPAPGAGEPAPADNAWSSFLAVTCADVDWPADVADYRSAVAEDRGRYPLLGAATANIMPCAFWHHEPSEPPVEITGRGPENVLILQNLRDAGTPYSGGVALDEKFGERSRLVSVDANGHGVYVYGDNECAWDVTTRYLVDGEFPEQDVSCR